MDEEDTQSPPQNPREDDRNVELDESPVPDPEATNTDGDDDPQAD